MNPQCDVTRKSKRPKESELFFGLRIPQESVRMSHRVKLPHCRKFPPRISQEDLKAQTTEVMKDKGANYHFQAQFYEATSHEVVGSPDIQFSTLQPKVEDHPQESWTKAYEFVYSFLKRHDMSLTLSTLKVEFQGSGEPKLSGVFDRTDHERFIGDLSRVAQGLRRVSFDQRVHEFITGQGWA
jgi:hypothetical protein